MGSHQQGLIPYIILQSLHELMLYMINKKKLTISENVEILIIFATHNQNKPCYMKRI